ncbi:agmatine deiminase family protein [Limibacter armeniacum]|uniref:agmatine deiminase family protein n=1 Tax=Limibacter armeniacum TaxID=466084 RepID=UPI002FE55E63
MSRRLPAEWEFQDAVQLTLPHQDTDWCDVLPEAQQCFSAIATEISKRQKLILACQDIEEAKTWLGDINYDNVIFKQVPSNDTWARDHAAFTVYDNEQLVLFDFMFNGWGLKFASDQDNQITRRLHEQNTFGNTPIVTFGFVLEGGSIESDGQGTLLTTSNCLLSYNRNPTYSRIEVENKLKEFFGANNVLWLDHGHLEGDDTDAHIDTLARLCDTNTIAYVQCTDKEDPHYHALKQMEDELKAFRTKGGKPYKLIALPMAPERRDPDDGHRLPATYANFLIMNGAVLVPTYKAEEADAIALNALAEAFPDREIIGIDCSVLIKQHGSLHCVTMQYPEGTL